VLPDLELLAVIANARRAMSAGPPAHSAQRQACQGVRLVQRSKTGCAKLVALLALWDSMGAELGQHFDNVSTVTCLL